MAAEIHQVALRALARRALSRHEVGARLERKGFGPGAIRAELARLAAAGLLNDGEVARSVVRSQLADGRGRRAVLGVLRRRGLGREAPVALEALGDEQEREALAHALARAARKYPGYRSLPPMRRKVIRYLLARGFSLTVALAALESDAGEDADAVEVQVDEPGDSQDLP